MNKVSSKVELRFHVASSAYLTAGEKALVSVKLAARITGEGFLQVVSQTERGQLANKARCVERFYELLARATAGEKARKASKPTYSSKLKRLQGKKRASETKKLRRRPEA